MLPSGNNPSDGASTEPVAPGDEFKSVTESLYKHNLELSIKNKTLSLLRQLYQISILTLEPQALAEKIATLVRETLEFELVGIYGLGEEGKVLTPIAFAASERLAASTASSSYPFEAHPVPFTGHPFLEPLTSGQPVSTERLADFWGNVIPSDALETIGKDAHLVSVLAHPLTIDGKLTGILLFGINRTYEKFNTFERESLGSVTDVAAVALDRARLYEAVQVANTKLKDANERLKELDHLKDEFLSIASHQLRAPMTAVRGYTANISDGSYGPVPDYLVDPLGTIQETSRLMINSIEDYLNISRIEQGRMKYEKSNFDFADLAKKVVNELIPVAEKRSLVLSIAAPEDLMINADIGKMKQVITNLVDNAIKYTEKGGVTVSLEKKEGRAVLTIADTGIGIAPEELGGLFEKFTRARGANKVNTTGTGLGLYVAKQLAVGNGGTIHAESDGVTKGSRFIVELPAIA